MMEMMQKNKKKNHTPQTTKMKTSKGIQMMTQPTTGDLISKLNHLMLNKTTFRSQSASHLLSIWSNRTLKTKSKCPTDPLETSSKVSRAKLSVVTISFTRDKL